MVQVTPKAIEHLAKLRSDRGMSRKAGARFVPRAVGVSYTFSDKPEPGDAVIDSADLPIYIAEEAAQRLSGSTIDVSAKGDKPKLVVVRQKAPIRQG
jgi:Fe-S cluster assembly iron-binding protein IscA